MDITNTPFLNKLFTSLQDPKFRDLALNTGLSILAANQPSATPQNPAGVLAQGVLQGQQLTQQQQQQQLDEARRLRDEQRSDKQLALSERSARAQEDLSRRAQAFREQADAMDRSQWNRSFKSAEKAQAHQLMVDKLHLDWTKQDRARQEEAKNTTKAALPGFLKAANRGNITDWMLENPGAVSAFIDNGYGDFIKKQFGQTSVPLEIGDGEIINVPFRDYVDYIKANKESSHNMDVYINPQTMQPMVIDPRNKEEIGNALAMGFVPNQYAPPTTQEQIARFSASFFSNPFTTPKDYEERLSEYLQANGVELQDKKNQITISPQANAQQGDPNPRAATVQPQTPEQQMRAAGFAPEVIKQESAGIEADPWVDPVTVGASGIGAAMPSVARALTQFGAKGAAQALGRMGATTATDLVMEPAVGTATEYVAEGSPELALPFNIAFGAYSSLKAQKGVDKLLNKLARGTTTTAADIAEAIPDTPKAAPNTINTVPSVPEQLIEGPKKLSDTQLKSLTDNTWKSTKAIETTLDKLSKSGYELPLGKVEATEGGYKWRPTSQLAKETGEEPAQALNIARELGLSPPANNVPKQPIDTHEPIIKSEPNTQPRPVSLNLDEASGLNKERSGGGQVELKIEKAAIKHGVPPELAKAVAITESNMNPEAVSRAGATGVMQLMPATAAELGVNAYDIDQNIDGGVRYLKQLINQFDGDIDLALAAYNAGPGAVKKYKGIPPFEETHQYITKVKSILGDLDSPTQVAQLPQKAEGIPSQSSAQLPQKAEGTKNLPANQLSQLANKTWKSQNALEVFLDRLRKNGYELPPARVTPTKGGFKWLPMGLRDQGGFIRVEPWENVEGAIKSMWTTVKEKFDPFSTTPEGQDYLFHRGIAKGQAARYREFAEAMHQQLKELPQESRKNIFNYMRGELGQEALSTTELRIGNRLKSLSAKVGETLYEEGLINSPIDNYVPYLYERYLAEGKGGGHQYWQARKDIPDERRAELGLIEDVATAVPIGLHSSLQDIAQHRLFRKVASDPKLVWQPKRVEIDGKVFNAQALNNEIEAYQKLTANHPENKAYSEYLDVLTAAHDKMGAPPDKGWKQMPSSRRWGALAGQYVRKEIHDDLVPFFAGIDDDSTFGKVLDFMGSATRAFKTMKVALNAPTTVRNIVSNIAQLNLSGIPLKRIFKEIPEAIKSIRGEDSVYKLAKKHGLFESSFAKAELDSALASFQQVNSMQSLFKNIQDLSKYYGMIDDVGKLLKFQHELAAGSSTKEAFLEAQKWGFDYSVAPKSIKALRSTVGLFATYPYKMLPRLVESAKERPLTVAKWAMLPSMLTSLSLAKNSMTQEDAENLRREAGDLVSKGAYALLPWKSPEGNWQWINLESFLPMGQIMHLMRNAKDGASLGDWAQDLGIGSPFINLGYGALSSLNGNNPKDSFTGKDIYDSVLDSPKTKVAKMANFIWNQWAPSMLGDAPIMVYDKATNEKNSQGFSALDYTRRAIEGEVDRYGRKVTPGQAIGRWAGVNMVSIPPQMKAVSDQAKIMDLTARLKQRLKDPNLPRSQREALLQRYRDAVKAVHGEPN